MEKPAPLTGRAPIRFLLNYLLVIKIGKLYLSNESATAGLDILMRENRFIVLLFSNRIQAHVLGLGTESPEQYSPHAEVEVDAIGRFLGRHTISTVLLGNDGGHRNPRGILHQPFQLCLELFRKRSDVENRHSVLLIHRDHLCLVVLSSRDLHSSHFFHPPVFFIYLV